MSCINDFDQWMFEGKKMGATHILVVCDTFDYEDYPVYVMPGEDVKVEYAKYNGPNMQRVHEVIEVLAAPKAVKPKKKAKSRNKKR